VRGTVGGGDDRAGPQFGARAAVPAGERHRHDQGAGRQVLAGGQDRADQRLGPDHDLGRAGDQREQEQPGLHLVGQVAKLADLAPVQRAAGDAREHRPVGKLRPDLGWAAAEAPERPVLGVTQGRHRAGQADSAREPVGPVRGGPPFGDLQHR
jgi:hypothetical protein